jgi:hypothetical protein
MSMPEIRCFFHQFEDESSNLVNWYLCDFDSEMILF